MERATSLVVSCLSIVFLFAGCQNSSSPTEPPTLPPDTRLQTVIEAQNTGIPQRRGEIVLTEDRWQEVWAEIHAGSGTPGMPAPTIDFSTEMVILAAMGDEPDSCWKIQITDARSEVVKISVSVAETRPPLSCACPAVVIQPVHVVRAPREELPGEFSFRRSVIGAGCG